MTRYLNTLAASATLVGSLSCLARTDPPAAAAAADAAAPADDAGRIVLGMSTALTGPAADLGLNMRRGVAAALDEVNTRGGVHGNRLELVSLDDGYEPSRTAPNMRRLIDEFNVLTVIGDVGTPTAVAAIPIANESKTLFYGAFTGAGVLRRTPPDRYVVNYRASYAEETAAMVDALVEHAGLRPEEIAFFTQRDAYGDAGYVGGVAALESHGLTDDGRIAHGRYERNTVAIENGLADLLQAPVTPRAVIMVGAYEPCAAFIRAARSLDFNPRFLNVSFVGTAPLAQALGDDGDGVIVTQVVPHFESSVPIVEEYRAALAASDDKAAPTFGSLEGYIATRILLRAMESVPGSMTRESIIDALESLGAFDIGLDAPLHLSHADHGACHEVWPTILRGGRAVPLDWSELAGAPSHVASGDSSNERE